MGEGGGEGGFTSTGLGGVSTTIVGVTTVGVVGSDVSSSLSEERTLAINSNGDPVRE